MKMNSHDHKQLFFVQLEIFRRKRIFKVHSKILISGKQLDPF